LKVEMDMGKFDLLEVMHHLTSGLKAWYCLMTHLGVDELRMCCGGAGYSEYSLFPALFSLSSIMPTVEGDTVVMAGQNAKLLFKKVGAINEAKAKGGKGEGIATDMFAYLTDLTGLCTSKNDSDNWKDLDHL
jgi:acyl-CoA oxidase